MRKAGLLKQALSKLADFDQSYAHKVRDLIPEERTNLRMLGGAALKDFELGSNIPADQLMNAKLGMYGVMGANAGVRYGLPTLGVLAAHKGISDLYNAASQVQIYGPQDQTNAAL